MVKNILFLLAALAIPLSVQAEIKNFQARQLPGTQDVEIAFDFAGEPAAVSSVELEVSLDQGERYQAGVKTFREGSAFFNAPLVEGLNRIIWNAGADFPGVYVDPAFLKMRVRMLSGRLVEFISTDTTQSIVTRAALPSSALLEWIGAQNKQFFYPTRIQIVSPGEISGATLDDLIAKIDPRVWTPPGPKDETGDEEPPVREQPRETDLNNEPGGRFKFDGFIEIRDNFPDPGEGKSEVTDKEKPIEDPGIFDTREPQAPLEEVLDGESAILTVLLGSDGGLEILSTVRVPGAAPLNFNLDAGNEEETSVADPVRPLILGAGDVVIAYYADNVVLDIDVRRHPFMEIAHNEELPPYHDFGEMPTALIRSRGFLSPKATHVAIYQALESTREFPIVNLEEFNELARAHLREIQRVSAERFRPADGAVQPQSVVGAVTAEQLWKSGPRSQKKNLVVIGDGFSSSSADQNKFKDYVQDKIMDGFATADIQPGYLNAVNIFRVDAASEDSGVPIIRRVSSGGNNFVQKNSLSTYVNWVDMNNNVFTLKPDTYKVSGPSDLDGDGSVDDFKVWVWDTRRDTAWNYAYAGDWDLCWTQTLDNHAIIISRLDNLIPEWDYCWVILNVDQGGGCNRGRIVSLTTSSGVSTVLHEWGHNFPGLADEYSKNTTYTQPGRCDEEANLDFWTGNRNDIKWRNWIPSWRPVPTSGGDVALGDLDAGFFLGGCYATNGIWRPALSGRMKSNSPLNSPIGFTEIRQTAYPHRQQDFRQNAVGDFDGDGLADMLISDDRQIGLFLSRDRDVGPDDPVLGQPPRAVSGVLEPTWFATDLLRRDGGGTSWEFRIGDLYYPGNFDGNEGDDLYVANLINWKFPYLCLLRSHGDRLEPVRRYDQKLPGWDDMREHDEFYTGDFDGDGQVDLAVFNGRDWSVPYLMLYRTVNNQLQVLRRFDKFLPGWEMGRNEKFFMRDINGDGRTDVVALNKTDWSRTHLHIYRSTGANLALTDRFYGELERPTGNKWPINSNDDYIFGDYNGDGIQDFALFNGKTWSPEYLGFFTFDGNGQVRFVQLYSDGVPGWNMKPSDIWRAFDRNGDGISDLVVFNKTNWSTQYLGVVRQDGKFGLNASWQDDWINGWNLGSPDSFKVADFRGTGKWDDLFIYNKNWFGLLRGQQSSFRLESIYHKWIQNQRYHRFGLY